MRTPKWVKYARKHYDDAETEAWEDPVQYAERHFYRCAATGDPRLFEDSIILLRMMRKIACDIPTKGTHGISRND